MKKLIAFLALLFLGIFMVSYSWAGEVRVWTSGKHTAKGEFVELTEDGTIVRIRKTNGKVVSVPLEKLSKEDVAYVRKIQNRLVKKNKASENTKSVKSSSKSSVNNRVLFPSNPKAGDRIVLTAEGIEYAFRWCPPGEFMMGSPENEEHRAIDETQHYVKLTRGFWLLETEVTQTMWQRVMGKNPSYFKGKQNPVERVSWYDCQEFCKKLSLKLGQQVQLPTEAQWEYACRAGTTGVYAGNLDEMAWYDNKDSKPHVRLKPHPVGLKKPNDWGLYDMHGNVYEWCSDYYAADYYSKSPTRDPTGPNSGTLRVFRGAGWFDIDIDCRSANRDETYPEHNSEGVGLRLLLVPGQE